MTVSIITIETPTLGDRTYLAHDGHVDVVVDPQRDIDRVLAVADEAGVQITHVLETHVHNDYVTGGLALAGATGAVYALNRDDEVGFERRLRAERLTRRVGPRCGLRRALARGPADGR